MPEIVKLSQPSAQDLKELREIYFETSAKKDFKDDVEKEAFFQKYLGCYLSRFPEHVWVARKGRILGYMVASPVTKDPAFYRLQPHLETFESFYEIYPAHLHVNFHQGARGMGLGGKLFSEVEKEFQGMGISGIHIMTGPDSRNKNFYQRLGFDFEVTLDFKGTPILLMGKTL